MHGRLLALAWSPARPWPTGLEVIEVAGEGANGTIVIDLFDDVAPQHVAQITALAAEGAYDGVVFHRVIDGFMAQTGDVQFGKIGGDMRRAGHRRVRPARPAGRVFRRAVRARRRGHGPRAGSRTAPTASSSSCSTPGHFLNGQYTVVGRVIEGHGGGRCDQARRGPQRGGRSGSRT